MLAKIINLIIIAVIGGLVWYLDFVYVEIHLERIFNTIVSFFLGYFVFSVLLNGLVAKTINGSKTRYSFRKVVNIIFLLIFLIVNIRVWTENTQVLLVSYGIIGAGLAVALQDLFKNFAGGLLIFFNRLYKVGDRIELNNSYGDVIDIGALYTTLLEIREWVDGDQPTGRLTQIPNGVVLKNNIQNYTKDHGFIWDEIFVPITYESDWKEAVKRISKLVKKETKPTYEQARKQFSNLKEKYYVAHDIKEPGVYVMMTDNWVSVRVRFIADARLRRETASSLNQKILNDLAKTKKVEIASSTQAIYLKSWPDFKWKKS